MLRAINSKPCLKLPLSQRTKMGFQDQLSLNAGQKYCRMFQGEKTAILLICIKQPDRVRIGKLFSLFLIQNICCGYSKEPSQ